MLETPLFENTGDLQPRKDIETIVRSNVIGIVEDVRANSILILDWKKFGWKSFVIGGKEEGETPEEAIEREIREETGYTDIKDKQALFPHIQTRYYAPHKSVNRESLEEYFHVRLNSLSQIDISESEKNIHSLLWVPKSEVSQILTFDNNKYLWHLFVNNLSQDREFAKGLRDFKGFI